MILLIISLMISLTYPTKTKKKKNLVSCSVWVWIWWTDMINWHLNITNLLIHWYIHINFSFYFSENLFPWWSKSYMKKKTLRCMSKCVKHYKTLGCLSCSVEGKWILIRTIPLLYTINCSIYWKMMELCYNCYFKLFASE